MRPITAAPRIASTTQTQVGVELEELVSDVVAVVFVGTGTLRVVVCSTVVTTVCAGAVVVSWTVVVAESVSVVVMSATPTAVSVPASSKPAVNSAARPTNLISVS